MRPQRGSLLPPCAWLGVLDQGIPWRWKAALARMGAKPSLWFSGLWGKMGSPAPPRLAAGAQPFAAGSLEGASN